LISLDGAGRRRKPSFRGKLQLADETPIGQRRGHRNIVRSNEISRGVEQRKTNDDRARKDLRQGHCRRNEVRIRIDAEHAVRRNGRIVLRCFDPRCIGSIRTKGELRSEHADTCK
jgi:hypothetical protein